MYITWTENLHAAVAKRWFCSCGVWKCIIVVSENYLFFTVSSFYTDIIIIIIIIIMVISHHHHHHHHHHNQHHHLEHLRGHTARLPNNVFFFLHLELRPRCANIHATALARTLQKTLLRWICAIDHACNVKEPHPNPRHPCIITVASTMRATSRNVNITPTPTQDTHHYRSINTAKT